MSMTGHDRWLEMDQTYFDADRLLKPQVDALWQRIAPLLQQ